MTSTAWTTQKIFLCKGKNCYSNDGSKVDLKAQVPQLLQPCSLPTILNSSCQWHICLSAFICKYGCLKSTRISNWEGCLDLHYQPTKNIGTMLGFDRDFVSLSRVRCWDFYGIRGVALNKHMVGYRTKLTPSSHQVTAFYRGIDVDGSRVRSCGCMKWKNQEILWLQYCEWTNEWINRIEWIKNWINQSNQSITECQSRFLHSPSAMSHKFRMIEYQSIIAKFFFATHRSDVMPRPRSLSFTTTVRSLLSSTTTGLLT